MKARSTLIIACLSIALLMVVGVTRAQADCCGFDLLAAPFVAAGAIVVGAAWDRPLSRRLLSLLSVVAIAALPIAIRATILRLHTFPIAITAE